MVTLRRKILIALLVIDVLVLASLLTSSGRIEGWLLLNFLAVVIWIGVKTRKKRRSKKSRAYDNKYVKEEEYGVESVTLKGETVKSKKEKIIADYLYQHKLRYEYEPPVFTNRRRSRSRRLIGYADFILLDFDIYIEYWGLVNADDPNKREEYTERMRLKRALYYQNGIKLISLYQSNLDNLDWAFRQEFKKITGFEYDRSL